MKKNIFNTVVILLMIVFTFSGCVEHRYYNENHQHSDGYNHRHHRVSTGIDVRIHN